MIDDNVTFSQSEVLTTIKKLKQEEYRNILIDCRFPNFKYNLILLTADCARNQTLMELIGRWRKENERWFLSQFDVTTARTTTWFCKNVIETPDRLLFIINTEKKYIGHVGLFRFDFENMACEIDNIVRGEPEYAGIMGDAILHLMDWGKTNLGIKKYLLKVVSNNERAIRLYNRLGFVEILRIPLIQVTGKDGLEWVEAPNECEPATDRYYIIMERVPPATTQTKNINTLQQPDVAQNR